MEEVEWEQMAKYLRVFDAFRANRIQYVIEHRLRTSIRMSIGMFISWERRPAFGCLIAGFGRDLTRLVVLVALARLRFEVRITGSVFSFSSLASAVLLLDLVDILGSEL